MAEAATTVKVPFDMTRAVAIPYLGAVTVVLYELRLWGNRRVRPKVNAYGQGEERRRKQRKKR